MEEGFIHPSVIIDEGAQVDPSCNLWHFSHVREDAILEKEVSLGKNVYIDKGVKIGAYSRVQNGVSIYRGIQVEPWSFVGPHVIFTNDQRPRVGKKNWKLIETKLKTGSSIGAGAIIICGVTIGSFSMVGAGAIVTKDIPPFHLALGAPAELKSKICACGDTMIPLESSDKDFIKDCCKENLRPELLEMASKASKDV